MARNQVEYSISGTVAQYELRGGKEREIANYHKPTNIVFDGFRLHITHTTVIIQEHSKGIPTIVRSYLFFRKCVQATGVLFIATHKRGCGQVGKSPEMVSSWAGVWG